MVSHDFGTLSTSETINQKVAPQADFQDALSICKGHEVVTVVGPVDIIKDSFDEAGIAYEVVEWEELYLAQLSEKEQKKYLKNKAKAEEAKKAKEAEEAAEKG